MRKQTLIGILFLLGLAFSGTTGKLTGKVTDARSGETLIGCNIMILDTDLGAATDSNGEYFILNIPPGNYEVRAMMIGYEMVTIQDLNINIDKTTRQPFQLSVQALQGAEVTVSATQKVIQFDVTNSESRVSAKELEVMPVTDVQDVIKLQGGITQDAGGGIHIRGGRTSEVMYMVDGVSMTDVFNGGLSVNIENSNIQELQVISGTFNAEYGKAMSGIINMVTKDGGSKFDGGFSIWAGDHTSQDDIYRNLSSYSLTNDLNIEGNFSGPLFKDRVSFYSSGRYFKSDGWLNGLNTFNMYGDTLFTDKNGNRYRDFAENFFDEQLGRWVINGEFLDRGNGRWDPGDPWDDRDGEYNEGEVFTDLNNNGVWDEGEDFIDTIGNLIWEPGEEYTDIVGNRTWDSNELFTDDPSISRPVYEPGETFADRGNSIWDSGEAYEDMNGNGKYDRGEPFTDVGNGVWDNAESLRDPNWRGMNWLEKFSSQNKLTFKLTPKTRLKLNFIYSYQEKQDYDHNRQLTQGGRKTDYDIGNFKGINLSHSFSSTTFFDLNLSTFNKTYKSYLYEDQLDPRYITPDSLFWAQSNEEIPNWVLADYGSAYADYTPDYSYSRWGVDGNHFKRETTTEQFKFDLTSQINKYNQVKFGLDYQQHKLEMHDASPLDMENDRIYEPLVPELVDLNDYFHETNVFLDSLNNTLPPEEQVPLLQEMKGNLPSWVQKIQFAGPFVQFGNYYVNEPREFAIYVQDKIEYGDMIVNIGLRYDYFDPNSYMPVNVHDPFFFNPQDPRLDSLQYENRWNDLLNVSWGDTSHYVVSINGADTTWYTYADFGDYPDKEELKTKTGWFRKTKTSSQFSPRLGIAYPISDRGVIHFSYGYFFQIPQFEMLYTNPGYVINEGDAISGIFGNPELKPQRTLSYEIGLQQELTSDLKAEITGYSRDVRDWVSTGVPVDLGIGGQTYYTYVNKDYSNVRGLILSLDKRFSDHYSWHLDYTFQVAEGSNSDPGQEYGALTDDNQLLEPTRFILPLNWDQSHTLNGDIYFGYGPWGADLLMQYGSGYPYTPTFISGTTSGQNLVSDLPNNSRRKPATLNFDLKMFHHLQLYENMRGKVFMNVKNLFDRRNEITIWSDTGRANKTLEENRAIVLNNAGPQPLRPNTIEDFFNRPEWYSAPREIQIGIELSW